MALQHLRSSTANKRPTPAAMSDGQIALNSNTASPGLFFKDSAGALIKVGPVHVGTTAPNASPASGGETGNTVGEQWLDTTGGGYVLKIWDGSAWRSEAGEFVNVNGDTMTGNLVMDNANIVFEGSTADDFETTLTVTDPTADRTITLPDVSGTVVTTGDTGSVTSTMLADGTIVDADISGTAEIAVSKLQNGTARQLLQTDAAGTGVEWASNIDIPGTLDVTSTATFDSIASHPLGTDSAPTITFTGDTDTGIYSPGADQVAVATSGAGRVFVDASGNVTINGQGDLRFADSDSSNWVAFQAPATVASDVTWTLPDADGSSGDVLSTDGAGTLSWTAGGGGGATDKIEEGNTSAEVIDTGSDGRFVVTTEGTEALRVDPSGRLLVGTSTARSNIDTTYGNQTPELQSETVTSNAPGGISIVHNSSGYPAYLALGATRGTSVGATTLVNTDQALGFIYFNGGDGTNLVEAATISAFVDGTPGANDMPGRLVFSTTADGASSPTERMRINNAGTHSFFCTATTAGIMATSVGAGTSVVTFACRHSASSTTTGTNAMYVYSNGNLVNTNNSYGSISDIKLKENIVDANSQWDDLKALQVRNYNFKEGQTHTQIGLIAQEVELVSPGLVSESPDRDEEGNDLGTVTKSVNYSVLYMKAVKALQEAMERIEQLETEMAEVKAQLS